MRDSGRDANHASASFFLCVCLVCRSALGRMPFLRYSSQPRRPGLPCDYQPSHPFASPCPTPRIPHVARRPHCIFGSFERLNVRRTASSSSTSRILHLALASISWIPRTRSLPLQSGHTTLHRVLPRSIYTPLPPTGPGPSTDLPSISQTLFPSPLATAFETHGRTSWAHLPLIRPRHPKK